jgi:SAM-dependent methyltransferase
VPAVKIAVPRTDIRSGADMDSAANDHAFSNTIAELYEAYLVPMIFAPYATSLVQRLPSQGVSAVLEVAAGTGVVTRALAAALPRSASIIATDLNAAMLHQAQTIGTSRPVEWRQAEAGHLPFADDTFDVVVCQFGVMFFPDKAQAFAEARRVLRPGGLFAFSVWDRIEENEFADTVTNALTEMFPDDPPRFMARIPHGYFDQSQIERDLGQGGFVHAPQIATVAARSRAASSQVAAIAYCQGTPSRNEIVARDAGALAEATNVVAAAIAARFGNGIVDGKIQAHVVTVAG